MIGIETLIEAAQIGDPGSNAEDGRHFVVGLYGEPRSGQGGNGKRSGRHRSQAWIWTFWAVELTRRLNGFNAHVLWTEMEDQNLEIGRLF